MIQGNGEFISVFGWAYLFVTSAYIFRYNFQRPDESEQTNQLYLIIQTRQASHFTPPRIWSLVSLGEARPICTE